ncbi:putative transcriptional regulator, partial [Dysosmobacter welbionis]
DLKTARSPIPDSALFHGGSKGREGGDPVCEIGPGGVCIRLDLGPQGVQGVEAHLLAQMLIKLQPQLFTVQVPLEVQETGLHCDVRAVLNRGAGAHVGDSGVAGAVLQCGPGGVYPVARHQHMRRNDEVGSGEQLGGADAPAVADCACQGVGVAQEAVGPADLPQLHQPADVGGADGDACHLHLGDDVTAQAQLGALLRQQLR